MSLVLLFAAASTPATYDYTASSAGVAAFMMIILAITFILVPLAYVISSLLLMRIFRKAGVESWKAWVPVYSTWKTFEIGEQPGYWAVLMFIPFVNIVAAVFLYIAYYRIGLNLEKSGAFVLLAIFLPIVWMIWLAFDSSTWKRGNITNDQPPAFTPPTFTPPTPPVNS